MSKLNAQIQGSKLQELYPAPRFPRAKNTGRTFKYTATRRFAQIDNSIDLDGQLIDWSDEERELLAVAELSRHPELYANFPEIVLRGAARLNPALKHYYGELPRDLYHYGGYYTLTEENWPLIGAMAVEGAYIAGAMSGFGTMAACASGDLCARWVLGRERPDFAGILAPQRYEDAALMAELKAMSSRGIL